LKAYLEALGGGHLVNRLRREDFGSILFGTDRFPSEMADDPLGDIEVARD
jgi:hypothetical protein